jgi:nucleolar pre-ribosomal-associated protein 1
LALRDWFRTSAWTSRSVVHIVPILKALLDTYLPLSPFDGQDEDTLATLCERIASEMLGSLNNEFLRNSKFCIEKITTLYSSVRLRTASFLQGKIKSIAKRLNPAIFSTAIHLDAKGSLEASAIEAGLKWAVDRLSLEDIPTAETQKCLSELRRAITTAEPKAHHAEPFITVAIQNHLGSAQVLEFICAVLERTQFKVREDFYQFEHVFTLD